MGAVAFGAVDHQSPKYGVDRWPRGLDYQAVQVLVCRQETPRAAVEAIRVLLMTVVTPFLKPRLPYRGRVRI